MKTVPLESFSAKLDKESQLLKEFKENYRPINPFVIFKVLSEGKEIARLMERDSGTKFIQTIRLKDLTDSFDSVYSYELLDQNDNMLDSSILKDTLRTQFYAKR